MSAKNSVISEFAQFLELKELTPRDFSQLVNESCESWWKLVHQIESSCFLQSNIEKARPFIKKLYKVEKSSEEPFKVPVGWKYLPVGDVVEASKKLYGSSLSGERTIKRAKEAEPRKDSEGIPCWIKITKLADIFGIPANPLEDTPGGREAYASIINRMVDDILGSTYVKDYPEFGFKNWRKGELTADRTRLTPANRKAWQILEKQSEDDFVIAPYGGDTGSLYAGYSVRRVRIRIVLSGNQFGQDAVMVVQSTAVKPDRFTKHEDLSIDCSGTEFSDAGDQFSCSPFLFWLDGELHFGCRWADSPDRCSGSAVGFLG